MVGINREIGVEMVSGHGDFVADDGDEEVGDLVAGFFGAVGLVGD